LEINRRIQVSQEISIPSARPNLSLLPICIYFQGTTPRESFETFINMISLKLAELPNDEIKAALAEIIIIQLHGYALRGEQPHDCWSSMRLIAYATALALSL